MTKRAYATVAVAILCAGLLGANAWLIASGFQPIRRDEGIEYLLVGASPRLLIAGVALALAVLAAAWRLAEWGVRRVAPGADGGGPAWIAPLALAGVIGLLPLLNLLPATGGAWGVVSYVGVGLRWWLAGGAVVLAFAAIDERTGGRLAAALQARARALGTEPARLEAALAVCAVVFAIASTPHLRFSPDVHGDEPKYLRYAENFYQGLGFDVSGQRAMADRVAAGEDAPAIADNFRLLVREAPRTVARLASALVARGPAGLLAPSPQARYLEAWFFRGAEGGVYQVHNPGLSFLLFPAYFIDRHLLSWDARSHPSFPTHLWMTNTFFLGAYALWGVVIFRFLRRYTGRDGLSWLLALTALLTLPVAAFPFQFYPEVVAGIMVFAVSRYVVFDAGAAGAPGAPGAPGEEDATARTRLGRAILYGVLAGYLPWLHVRLAAVSLVLVLYGAASARRDRARAVAFVCAAGVVLGVLAFYSFHLTGSILPTATYSTEGGGSALDPGAVAPGLIGITFDRRFGLLAHAPIFLVAVAGLVPLARRRPAVAVLAAASLMSLAVPLAGHGWTSVGATPLRQMVAVIPFLLLPIADAVTRFERSRVFRVLFGLLLLMSVQNAWAYNREHLKQVGHMVHGSVSGWKPSLLFPLLDARTWDGRGMQSPWLWLWVAGVVALAALPALRRRRAGGGAPGRPWPYAATAAVTLLVFVGAGSAAARLGGVGFEADYLTRPLAAREALIRALTAGKPWVLWSSHRGRVTAQTIVGNEVSGVQVAVASPVAPARNPVRLRLTVTGAEPPWGRMLVRFGDGDVESIERVIGALEVVHVYRTPGIYTVAADFFPPSAPRVRGELTLTIRAAER